MTTVDFSGFKPEEVLLKLWEGSKPAAFFSSWDALNANLSPPSKPSIEMCFDVLSKNRQYVDYFEGRVIKGDFSKFPMLGNRGYDRDNGQGAMEKVRSQMLEKQ